MFSGTNSINYYTGIGSIRVLGYSSLRLEAAFAGGQVGLQIACRLSVRQGQSKTDLGLAGQASWVPGGAGKPSANSI